MKNRFPLMAAAAVALSLSYPALAAETPAPQANLTDDIQALRARIDQLESRQKEAERLRKEAEQKLEERTAADQLSRQAAQSDQFITAEGFTAGFTENKFVIQSSDGNFSLHPWYQLQFRGVALDREGFQGNKVEGRLDEWDTGFEVRQLRFGVDGNMFSPDLTYFFNWATQRTSASATVKSSTGTTVGTVSNSLGGVPVLQQGWVKYHFPTSPWYIKAGEMKDPVTHEQIVDTRYQQLAERSLSADIFANGDDYTEAVTFIYDPQTDIRAEGGINHGMRSANTNFLSYPDNGGFNQFNYGFVGRVDYKVMGRWNDYNQMGGIGTKESLLVFGLGADYSERGHAGQLVAVADATYTQPTGMSLYGALFDRYTTHNFGYYVQSPTGAVINPGDPAVANRATNEYSIVLQAAYLLDQHIEPFARYEFIRLQGTPAGSKNNLQAIAGGMNYYYYGHRLKLTGEILWLPEGLPFDDTSNDVLTNVAGRGEISFIAQLQLAL